MKVLVMSKPGNFAPWADDFAQALGDGFEVAIWQPDKPFAEQVRGAIAVADIGAPLSGSMIEEARGAGVRLWQMISAGYDHLDLDAFRANGIPVANTPGPFSATALAEHALMLMLLLVRRFRQSQEQLADGIFFRNFGDELAGRSLGLVGLGASGRALARIARAIGMRVSAIDIADIPASVADELGVEFIGGPDRLTDLVSDADFVSIHVPLTPETREMIDADCLAAMKSTAALINVSRGGIVDQPALVAALREGRLSGAGLDVFAVEPLPADDPLLTLDSVVLTPHVAGITYPTSRRRGQAAAENVARVAAGGEPLYVVT
jgi:phosphoglycerate dehydrogenase-like enzyme